MNYKEDGIRMGKIKFTRRNFNEAEQELKEILSK